MIGHRTLRYLLLYMHKGSYFTRSNTYTWLLNFRHHGELNPGRVGLGLVRLPFELRRYLPTGLELTFISLPTNQYWRSFNDSAPLIRIISLLLNLLIQ